MLKNLTVLLAISFIFLGCGRNPHVEKKTPKLDTILTPPLEPNNASPLLVLKDAGTQKEDVMDFGLLKTGEKTVKLFKLENIGAAKAFDIVIPEFVGKFKITNLSCGQELDAKEHCQLSGEILSDEDKLEKNNLVINFKDPAGKKLKARSLLLASVRRPVIPKDPEARLVLFVKNNESGSSVLKDVPVGEIVQIQLELRNVGDAEAKNVVIPTVPAPFVVKTHNCPVNLAINAACDIVIDYAPTQPKSEDVQVRISFDDGYLIHVIAANSINLDSASKLEVVDGVISQDIYELMDIRPEQLSPFQDVRGIDLGTVTVNEDRAFSINLDNLGASAATVTKIKDFTSGVMSFNQRPYPGQSGTCSLSISRGQCSLDVKLSPRELGNIHDLFEITYQDNRGNIRRLSLILMAHVKAAPVTPVDPAKPDCKIITARTNFEQSQIVRALTDSGNYKLPYKLSAPKSTAKLSVLFNNDSNHNLRMTKNQDTLVVPSNHNAMVQFGFNVSREEVSKFKQIKIELDILKLSTEGVKFDTTEVLCLNETKRCSGTFFIDSNYSKLNTANYVIHSNYFSSELLRSSQQNIAGLREVLAARGTLPAQGTAKASDSLFRLKKRFPVSSLFGSLHSANLPNGLNFVLSDDSVLLSPPRLILESQEAACSSK